MTKKVLSIMLSFLTLLFLFTSCGSKGTDAQIVLPIDKQPDYLDPQIVSETGAKNIIANCFEGLVTYDEAGNLVEAACEKYEISEDGLTYTFYLRKDGRWRVPSSAKETILKYYANDESYNYDEDFDLRVTADDFVFALRRALMPETKCPYAQNLMNIKNAKKVNTSKLKSTKLGVEAQGDYVLKIYLEKADCDFLHTLTLPACMPCKEEFFEITAGHYGLYTNYLIFNGPFYISGWSEKTAITARRNEYYRATKEEIDSKEASSLDEVMPKSIYFSFNSEQETRDKKIKDGTYEIAPLTEKQAAAFLNDKRYTVNAVKSAVTSLVFNCNDEYLKNESLRKAIYYAMDSDIASVYFSKNKASGIVPYASVVGNKVYRSEAGEASFGKTNEKKAQSLFKKALKELEISDVELTVICEAQNETAIRSIMQKWQSVFGAAFGISVMTVEKAQITSLVASKDYQIALYDVVYSDATAVSALSVYKSDSRDNIANYSSKTYDNLLLQVSNAKTQQQRIKSLLKAENYLLESCVVIPLCESEVYYVLGKGVSSVIFNPTGEVAYFKSTLSN